jgi:hypothetical protein
MSTNGQGWLSLEAVKHKTVLSLPDEFEYSCRVKVSRDGARLRLYVSLGPGKVKAIFIDTDGNILSQGYGETIAKAAEDAGAEGVL